MRFPVPKNMRIFRLSIRQLSNGISKLKRQAKLVLMAKAKKLKKSPAQMWPYPEKEYVTRGVNGLSYKENVISLLYNFAEEVMDQNPGKKVYVIEDNAPAYQKASRLCKQECLDQGIEKTK